MTKSSRASRLSEGMVRDMGELTVSPCSNGLAAEIIPLFYPL